MKSLSIALLLSAFPFLLCSKADTVTSLTDIGAGLSTTDTMYIVNVEATGAARDRKITMSSLITLVGSNLSGIAATAITSGTLPDARFPATLPAASGFNLTALNASNIASGTLATARLTTSTGEFSNQEGKVVIFGPNDNLTSNSSNDYGVETYILGSSPGGLLVNMSGSSTAKAVFAESLAATETAFYAQGTGALITANNGSSDTFTVSANTGNLTTSGTITGNGSGLTTLSASNLSSGTVATARLGSGTANSSTYLRGDNTWATPAGGGASAWTLKTGAYTAVSGDRLIADTSSGGFAITLPATPSTGDNVEILDKNTSWLTSGNLTIGRNGQNINGAGTDLTLATSARVLLVYTDGYGWRTFIGPSMADRLVAASNGAENLVVTANALNLADQADFVFSTSNGNKIANDVSQKFAFWGATPITRPSLLNAASAGHSVTGSDLVDITALHSALDTLGGRINEIISLLETLGLVTPN